MGSQLNYLIHKVLLVGVVSVALGLVSLCTFCWILDYTTFTTTILSTVGKLDWRAYFENDVFPISKFYVLRCGMIIFCILYGFLIAWGYYHRILPKIVQPLATFLISCAQGWQASFIHLKHGELAVFITIVTLFLIRTVWHIEYYALEYDEAWTYNHFTSKGPLISAISPNNNHIFYTILSSILDYLPIPTKWVIRLPSLLGGIFTLLLYFATTRKLLGVKATLVSLSYFAFSSTLNIYSVLGRGYIWQLVFGILVIFAVYQITLQREKTTASWSYLYVISFTLGMYSNPTFIYLGTGGAFFWGSIILLKKNGSWFQYWKVQTLTIVISLFLYVPLFLTNGLNFLIEASQSSQSISSEAMLYYFHRIVDWLFLGKGNLLFWYFLAFLLLCIFIGIWHRNKTDQYNLFLLALIGLCFPFIYTFFTWSQPPYRIWGYLVFFVAIIFAYFTYIFSFSKTLNILIILVLGSSTYVITEQHYSLNWSADLDKEAKKLARLMIHKNVQNCYTFSKYDKPLLEFYFLDTKQTFKCWMPFEKSKDYQAFEKHPYDAVLLDIDDFHPKAEHLQLIKKHNYQLIYQNHRIKLYLNPNL